MAANKMLLANHHQTPGYDAQIHTTRYGATCLIVSVYMVHRYEYVCIHMRYTYTYLDTGTNTYIHRYHHRYTHVVSHGWYDIMVYTS